MAISTKTEVLPLKAGGTIAQYRAVYLNGTDDTVTQATANQSGVGVSDSSAASGESVAVITEGIAEVAAGGTINAGARVKADGDGKAVTVATTTNTAQEVFGIALRDAVSGDTFPVKLERYSIVPGAGDDACTVALTTGEAIAAGTAVKVGAADGVVIYCDANEIGIGIAESAIADATVGEITVAGLAEFTAGTGGITRGDLMEAEADGTLITATDNTTLRNLIGVALDTTADTATGTMVVRPGPYRNAIA